MSLPNHSRSSAKFTIVLGVLGLITSLFVTIPTAHAEEADPQAPSWSGTLAISYSQTFDVHDVAVFSASGSATYTNVLPVSNGAIPVDYVANVNAEVAGSHRGYCVAANEENRLLSTFEWAYNGSSDSTVDGAGNPMTFIGGNALRIWDTEDGTFLMPYGVVGTGLTTASCDVPDTNPYLGSFDALSYHNGWTISEPTKPLVDNDPDPNRLVGTTTYSLANFPNEPAWNYSEYQYTLTYELTRTENPPPDAVDDTASTTPGVPVDINVLANDSDPDGDAISVDSCTGGSFGTVQVVDGYARYTPAAGFTGTDSFSCTIVDGAGGSDSAVVTVTVAPLEVTLHSSIDYQVGWFDHKVGLKGKNGGADLLVLRGISKAWVTGDAPSLSMVQQVCITPKFQVVATSNVTQPPVLWTDGSRDPSGQNDPFWNNPVTFAGGFGSELTPRTPVCSQGASVAWSPEVLRAYANQLEINFNLVGVTHTLDVTVHFVNGRTYPATIFDTEKAPKKTPNIRRMEAELDPIKIIL